MESTFNSISSNPAMSQVEASKSTKNNYLIFFIALVVVILLAGLFYYLYNTYPNMPSINLREEGYRVSVSLDSPRLEIPINIYRNSFFISNLQNTSSHFFEYVPPGNHIYEFRFVAENLLGIEKNFRQTKQLAIKELATDELRQFFDFPSMNLTSSKYGVYLSYSELKKFSELEILRSSKNIKFLSVASTTKEFLEHVPPGKYIYEIVFSGEEFRNLDGFLRQDYEIEIDPIPPVITSVKPTPLYRGYSSEIIATVENASVCKADLLLYPPSGFERAGPTVLKSYEFRVGDGLDYFYRHNESWSWKEILFPKPTDINTANYDLELGIICSDYYNSISAEKTGKLPTAEGTSPKSISISYHKDESGVIYGEVANQTWTDFNCRLLIGDQSNYTLDEKTFLLEGRHVYKFNIGSYNRNFLYVTAICKDDKGNGVTKISTYQVE